MILDDFLLCSKQQAITVDAASDYSIDHGSNTDISRGQTMRARCQVDVAFTSGGAGTLDVQLVESDNADLSSPTVLTSTGNIALATLVAGYVAMDRVVPRTSKRYIGFYYDNGTAAFTAGKVTAGLVEDTPSPISGRPVGNTGL